MGKAVALRADYDAAKLRALARVSHDAGQTRRLLALAAVGGVTLQMVRDWVLKFNAGGPDGLIDGKAPGPEPLLNGEQQKAVAAMIDAGPIAAAHGVVRWRLVDLVQWVFEEFRVSVSQQTMSRIVRSLGYRKLSARPKHHAQADGAIAAFKKTSLPAWRKLPAKGASSPAT